jgi:phasin family protein
MNQQIFTQAIEQFNAAAAPAKRANALFVSHLEQLTQFQLEAAKNYADIGLEQLRAALSVTDAKSLQGYVANQSTVAQDVSKKLAADGQTIAGLNQKFAAELQKLTQESAAVVGAKVKPAARKAA